MNAIDWWQLVLLAGVGLISGFLNVLAGGGSLLTLPMLIFIGLPAAEANGTNRIGIAVQNIIAIRSFRKSGVLSWRLATMCSLPAIVGACIGAYLAVEISEELFRQILAAVMVLMVIITAIDPVKRYAKQFAHPAQHASWPLMLGFFAIGVYGGFIQAGIGFLILIVTTLVGLDLVRGNVLKVVVILIFTIPALAIFAWHGQVDWFVGLILASGNAAGAAIAAPMAVNKGHEWIRRLVTIVVVLCAVKLFFW
jgi:hypothetical protein